MRRLIIAMVLLMAALAAWQAWQSTQAIAALTESLHYATSQTMEARRQLAAEREMRVFYEENIATAGRALIDAQARLGEALIRVRELDGPEIP